MTFEDHLRIAAGRVACNIADRLPDEKDCTHVFSERFEKNMQGFLDNWGKKKKHPVVRKILLIAAAILLAFAILMVASPQARAAVSGWFSELYEIFTVYRFRGSPSSETEPEGAVQMPGYELKWVPEGYEYYQTVENGNTIMILYLKNDSFLTLQYMAGDEGTALYIGTDGYLSEEVMIGNLEGIIYISPYDNEGSIIVWQDEATGILFTVDAPEDKETLIRIAESVKKVDK